MWGLGVGEDSDKGKPIVTLNTSFMTEVHVGKTLSPTGKVKPVSCHVLYSPKKTVVRWTVFMFRE